MSPFSILHPHQSLHSPALFATISLMSPDQFVAKWANVTLPEKAASQSHFNDLCALLEVKNPIDADPTGHDYCFEKPVHPIAAASKGSKGDLGFVDVWKRGHFAWEYKRKDKYKNVTLLSANV